MHSPSGPPRVPLYDFSAPTETDVTAALTRVFGPERGPAFWRSACESESIPVGSVQPSEIERLARALAAQGGPCVAVARSIEIRLRTYERLAARAAQRPQGIQ